MNIEEKFVKNKDEGKKTMEKVKIGIIGLGMVGMPIMRWFLEEKKYQRGKDIFLRDADPKKGYSDNVNKANIIFICVPTPPNEDGSCNISIVESVIRNLPDRKDRRNWCVVVKSTVPPETVEYLCGKYRNKGCFLFNPEFLTEKQAWVDFIRPDRQIVAAADEESRRWLGIVLNLLPSGIYNSPGFFQTDDGEQKYHFHEASSTDAETAKYAGNAFGATKVTFSNVIADFCELIGANYENVRQLVSHDRRIGGAWMDVHHGDYRGFGGFCFPKDLDALIAKYDEKIDGVMANDRDLSRKYIAAVNFLKAMRDYNTILLESQNIILEEVCHHDIQVDENIKNKKSEKTRRGKNDGK